MATKEFSVESLSNVISQYDYANDYVVAYSGGLDSHVLLHALSVLAQNENITVTAVHVNHGWSPNSANWVRHCGLVCKNLKIPLNVISVDAKSGPGASPEAYARDVRYSVLAEYLKCMQALVTAHHLDDQAETFLLQLLRGAGLRGLSSMPACQVFSVGWLIRPLLEFSRESLHEYALVHDLKWIEDESNSDTDLDRNYLRHTVIPLILDRWPSAHSTLSRAASHAANTSAMADMLARQDRIKAMSCRDTSLSVPVLKSLDTLRRYNLLRTWIRDNGYSVPSTKVLECLGGELLDAAGDSMPLVEWPGAQIRRFQQRIYLLPPLPSEPGSMLLPCSLTASTDLPIGKLQIRTSHGQGLSIKRCTNEPLIIRFRNGGESLRPVRRHRTIALKKILQDSCVPPWLRNFVPLICSGDTIVAVAGIAIHEDWQTTAGEVGYQPIWEIPTAFSEAMPRNLFEPRE